MKPSENEPVGKVMMLRKCSTTNNLGLFCQEKPISEIGNQTIDQAIFCWSLQTLQPAIDDKDAVACFSRMKDCYDDKARFFHRGLGHPRQLILLIAQQAYRKLIPAYDSGSNPDELMNTFDRLIPNEQKIFAAQRILGSFYHDVIHRKGKYHDTLLPYAMEEKGLYRILSSDVPLSASLFLKESTRVVEELSGMVAEIELNRLGVAPREIIPIIMACYCTIPFSNLSEEAIFNSHLARVMQQNGLTFIDDEEKANAYAVAVGVSNRDKGAYGEGTLNDFNIKTWAMMFERNPNLLTNSYPVHDLAQTFSEFYASHKVLYQQIVSSTKQMYYGAAPDSERTNMYNKRAIQLLALDIQLQGILLGVTISTIHFNENGTTLQSLESLKDPEHLNELPEEILTVLTEQGKEVTVNGITFTRGSSVTQKALFLIECLGVKTLLRLAENFQAESPVPIDEIIDLSRSSSMSCGPH